MILLERCYLLIHIYSNFPVVCTLYHSVFGKDQACESYTCLPRSKYRPHLSIGYKLYSHHKNKRQTPTLQVTMHSYRPAWLLVPRKNMCCPLPCYNTRCCLVQNITCIIRIHRIIYLYAYSTRLRILVLYTLLSRRTLHNLLCSGWLYNTPCVGYNMPQRSVTPFRVQGITYSW